MQIGGGARNAFQFNNVGDKVSGEVVSVESRQQTDMNDGEPKVWYKKAQVKISEVPVEARAMTQPVMAPWVVVQTAFRNYEGLDKPDKSTPDDGKRTIVFNGNKYTALTKVTGDVSEGGFLSVEMKGVGEPPKRGFQGPKLFEGGVVYTPPKQSVAVGGPAQTEPGQGATPSAATASTTDGVQHGPKPDYLSDEAWAAIPGAERAKLSPF